MPRDVDLNRNVLNCSAAVKVGTLSVAVGADGEPSLASSLRLTPRSPCPMRPRYSSRAENVLRPRFNETSPIVRNSVNNFCLRLMTGRRQFHGALNGCGQARGSKRTNDAAPWPPRAQSRRGPQCFRTGVGGLNYPCRAVWPPGARSHRRRHCPWNLLEGYRPGPREATCRPVLSQRRVTGH